MQNNINGRDFDPTTVPATMKFLQLVADSEFDVLEDFHPAVDGALTLVDSSTQSAITLLIFESAGPSEGESH